MNRNRRDISLGIEEIRDGRRRLDHNPEFAALVKDKRVVIVGPARTLLGKNQGRFIDSHDVVVRINDVLEHFPPSKDLAADIGTKADVVYCNQVILRKNILAEEGITRKRFFQICSDANVRSFVCTNNSLSYDVSGRALPSCPKADRSVMADFRTLLSDGQAKASLRVVYGASEILIRWLGGNWGRTGFVAILDLLGFGIRQLTVTGMTFYHGGGHLFAPESANLHPQRNRDGSSSLSPSGQGHDSFLEIEVMRLLKEGYGTRLAVDDHLARILETSSPEGITSDSLSSFS